MNHRPAFGLEPEKVLWAFEKLGDVKDTLERGELLDLLQNRGKIPVNPAAITYNFDCLFKRHSFFFLDSANFIDHQIFVHNFDFFIF